MAVTLYGVNTSHDKSHNNLLAKSLISGQIGNAFFIFKSDLKVYKESSRKTEMYKIKNHTFAKITSIKSTTSDGVILGLAAGSKTVYIKYASYKLNTSGINAGAYFTSTSSNQIGWQNTKVAPPQIMTRGDYFNGIKGINTYINLNSGGSLDESRILEKYGSAEDEENLEDTQEAIANDAIAGTTAAANGTTGTADGDIQVTYEFAVKPAPTFFYNIGEHLARYKQLAYDEEGNVKVDEEGNVIYTTDENGNALMGGPKDSLTSYQKEVSVNGVNYKALRNIFGAPYQFLPSTDCRISNGKFIDNLELAGYEFNEKILSRMPLLFITPGNTSFMGGSSENARTALIGSLDETYVDKSVSENSLKAMLEDYNGKLYTIMPAYGEYFNYVNPMCRAGAIFLGLAGNTEAEKNKTLYGKTLDVFHWGVYEGQDYTPYIEEDETILGDETAEEIEGEVETPEEDANGVANTENATTEGEEANPNPEEDNEIEEEEKYDWEQDDVFEKADNSFLKDFQQVMYYGNAIPFYINSESSFQDSFSNETTESTLSSTINALSDRAREVQFLLGTASNAVGEAFDKVDGTLTEIKEQIDSIVSKVAGGNSIFTTIANSVKTIVSGGRLLFPQIWSNSSFTKSYNISIKLTTPSYDKFSWWLNIYVPLCHLMALVLPRSEYINSYTTPFLIKAFYRGMFNIDMGIITEMSFNRGKEGSWTKDGLPTVVDVSFSIQDLYTGMGMTSIGSMFKGTTLQNVSEMDYIANLCGININEPDVFRMVTLWATFNLKDRVGDFLPNLSMNIGTTLRNKGMSIYNSLWGL